MTKMTCPHCGNDEFRRVGRCLIEIWENEFGIYDEPLFDEEREYTCNQCEALINIKDFIKEEAEEASSVSSSGEGDIQVKKAEQKMLSCPECKYTLFYRVLTNSVEVFAEGDKYRCEVKDGGEVRFRCTSCGGEFYTADLEQVEAEQASSLFSYSQARCGSECSPDLVDSDKSTRTSPCGNQSERRYEYNGNTNAKHS